MLINAFNLSYSPIDLFVIPEKSTLPSIENFSNNTAASNTVSYLIFNILDITSSNLSTLPDNWLNTSIKLLKLLILFTILLSNPLKFAVERILDISLSFFIAFIILS